MCTACTLLVGRPMDHSTLSIKNCGQHISANRQLYVNEAKSGKTHTHTHARACKRRRLKYTISKWVLTERLTKYLITETDWLPTGSVYVRPSCAQEICRYLLLFTDQYPTGDNFMYVFVSTDQYLTGDTYLLLLTNISQEIRICRYWPISLRRYGICCYWPISVSHSHRRYAFAVTDQYLSGDMIFAATDQYQFHTRDTFLLQLTNIPQETDVFATDQYFTGHTYLLLSTNIPQEIWHLLLLANISHKR